MRTAMPSPVARHESSTPCAPPTDPTGFIHSSYQAAPTETQRDKPSSNSLHQGVAYVSSSVGGSVSTLSFEDTKASNRLIGGLLMSGRRPNSDSGERDLWSNGSVFMGSKEPISVDPSPQIPLQQTTVIPSPHR